MAFPNLQPSVNILHWQAKNIQLKSRNNDQLPEYLAW